MAKLTNRCGADKRRRVDSPTTAPYSWRTDGLDRRHERTRNPDRPTTVRKQHLGAREPMLADDELSAVLESHQDVGRSRTR